MKTLLGMLHFLACCVASGQGTTGWQYSTPLPAPRTDHGMASGPEHIYVLGGFEPGLLTDRVDMSQVLSDGQLGPWVPTTPLSEPRAWTGAVATDSHLYAIGGTSCQTLVNCTISTVEYAPILADGTVGDWQYTTALNGNGRCNFAVALHQNRIYCVGGYSTGLGRLNSIEVAEIQADGSLGPWEISPQTMSQEREKPFAAFLGNSLIVGGGLWFNTTAEFSTIALDGSLGDWLAAPELSAQRYKGAAVSLGDSILVAGGYGSNPGLDTSEILEWTGSDFVPWVSGPTLRDTRVSHAMCTHSGFVYASGGLDFNNGTLQDSVERLETAIAGLTIPSPVDCDLSGLGYVLSASPFNGSALRFDGQNDYVQIGDSATFEVVEHVTMEAWILPIGPGSNGNEGGIIVNKEGEYEFARFADGNIWWAFGHSVEWANTGFFVPLLEWNHVAVVFDAGTVKTYGNGELVHTDFLPGSIGDFFPGFDDLRIGGRQNWDQHFDGIIDNVRVWNVARTQQQIAEDMYLVTPENTTGLVGAWSFEEGVGLETSDLLSQNPGMLVGAVWVNTIADTNGNKIPDDCESRFLRGDCSGDGVLNIVDPIALLLYLFLSGDLPCPAACDSNDNGTHSLDDVIWSLSYLFGGLSELPGPFPVCGSSSSSYNLYCENSVCGQ